MFSEIFTNEQIEKIHTASLRILEKIGIVIPHDEVLARFSDALEHINISGAMAQENAEILAGVCVTQIIKEGMPVCYGGICHAFDMVTTQMIFSGPEQAIFGVAMTQMGKYYRLPVYINVGLTDSKQPDAQAGLEIGITLALGISAGADIFGHMGICGVGQATHFSEVFPEKIKKEFDKIVSVAKHELTK